MQRRRSILAWRHRKYLYPHYLDSAGLDWRVIDYLHEQIDAVKDAKKKKSDVLYKAVVQCHIYLITNNNVLTT